MVVYRFIKPFILDIWRIARTQLLKFKYRRTLARLRRDYGNRKIVIAFCVSELAKWKCQSLYEYLEKTDTYLPVIYIYPSPLELNDDIDRIGSCQKEKDSFFKTKGMRVVNVWDYELNKCVIPKHCKPDIIFYQQPWDTPPFPLPFELAGYALTFYIPYYLVNNLDINLEFGQRLHYQLFGYIVENDQLAEYYTSFLSKRNYVVKCLGLGHTIVDSMNTRVGLYENNSVIYAPHFSFPVASEKRVLTYSTFLDNGKLILEFAKKHPEIDWVFKPHPRLRLELERTGVWTKEEVDAYYNEWQKIGEVCTTSEYARHFQSSFAMITDCGSFLTEYSCMDKPLIRLYYHKENLPPNPILEKLYDTFYYAHDNGELAELLEAVVCRRRDPKQESRHEAVTALGLNRSDAADRIWHYLDNLLKS